MINRKNLFHKTYELVGRIICDLCLMWWNIRDKIFCPKTDSILFVAHPDDDTLFFHTYIKGNKPYVVLLFTGWSIRRLCDFIKVMKHYGVSFRAYNTVSANAYYDEKRRSITKKHIFNCLKIKSFSTIAFHNSEGEYGHYTHKLVHEAVKSVCQESKNNYVLLCPVKLSMIDQYPLYEEDLYEKEYVFDYLYKSEKWVMTEEKAGTPIWFFNEKLERIGI